MTLKQLLKVLLPTVVYLGLCLVIPYRRCISLFFRILQRDVEHRLVFLALLGLFYKLDRELLLSLEIVKSHSIYFILICVIYGDRRRGRFIVIGTFSVFALGGNLARIE